MVDIVVGRRVDQGFSLMPNALARDPKASPRAIRVYCFLNSHAEGWKTSAARIAGQIDMNEKTVRTALRELESLGYLERAQSRDGANQFDCAAYMVHQISEKPQVSPDRQNLPDGDSSRPVKITQREHAGETGHNRRSVPTGKNYRPLRRLKNKTNSRVTGGEERYGGHRAGDHVDPQPENSLGGACDSASGASARSDAPGGGSGANTPAGGQQAPDAAAGLADGAADDAGVADSGSQPEPNTTNGSQSVSNASNPRAGAITPDDPQKSASGSHSGENGDEIPTLDQLATQHQAQVRCERHAKWPADKPVPNCVACQNTREQHENHQQETQAAARARRRAAQAICTTCDDDGLIAGPNRRYATCGHPNVTRGQVADYLRKQTPRQWGKPEPPKRKLAPMPIEKYPKHAREKPCPECEQPAGKPCKLPDGYQPPAPCSGRILTLTPKEKTQ